ncbi:MAG: FmdB family zinc ribbon protein [Planctomycetota bacterium]
MPLYEYQCTACKSGFELLIRRPEDAAADKLSCPHCHSSKVEKQLSVPAAPSISGSSISVGGTPSPGGGCGLPQCGSGGCQWDG